MRITGTSPHKPDSSHGNHASSICHRILAAMGIACLSTFASAQTLDPSTLSDTDLADLRAELVRQIERVSPVAIMGIRSGFGLSFGDISVGAAATNMRERRYENDFDASLGFAFGLGDAGATLGATVGVDVTSVSPFHFGQSGLISFTLHRRFDAPGDWQGSIAVSAENIVTWGDSDRLSPEYTLTTTFLRPGGMDGPPLLATFGYGAIPEGDDESTGFFGGLGVGLSNRTSASLAWTGDELVAGLSIWSNDIDGAVLTIGVGDLTNEVGGRRALLAVSWSGNFNSF